MADFATVGGNPCFCSSRQRGPDLGKLRNRLGHTDPTAPEYLNRTFAIEEQERQARRSASQRGRPCCAARLPI